MNTKLFERHTPGPWAEKNYQLVGSNGDQVVFSSCYIALGSVTGHPSAAANACLALAAPDLLAECDRLMALNAELVAALEQLVNGHSIIDAERGYAALARAKEAV